MPLMTSEVGSEVLMDTADATAGWLTGALRRDGVLRRGRVESVHVAPATPGASRASVVRLAVQYTADADPVAPRALLLKMAPSESSAAPSAEVAFCRLLAPRMQGFPTPRCFDAAQNVDGTHWHLLLEDVSETHDQPPYPVPPSEPHCYAAVARLAELHAAWWEHPDLMEMAMAAGVRVRTEGELGEVVARTEQTVTAFLMFLGDRISAQRRRTYERLLANQVSLRGRQLARPRTLAHGDAHWWNFLYPREGKGHEGGCGDPSAGVLMIDWASWTAGPALEDLAHAIALAWFPERRRRLERPLLEHYHRELCRRGVTGYGWETCWEDYRLFAATRPFTLAFQWRRGGWPLVWGNNFERAMLAFDDLHCEELLERRGGRGRAATICSPDPTRFSPTS